MLQRLLCAYVVGLDRNGVDLLQRLLCTYVVGLDRNGVDLLQRLLCAYVVGLDRNGVDLLQRYTDNTGDVQTAALVMIHSFPSHLSSDPLVNSWIDK